MEKITKEEEGYLLINAVSTQEQEKRERPIGTNGSEEKKRKRWKDKTINKVRQIMPRKIREMDDIKWKSGEEGRMNIYKREGGDRHNDRLL